jgi:hypothetical protein
MLAPLGFYLSLMLIAGSIVLLGAWTYEAYRIHRSRIAVGWSRPRQLVWVVDHQARTVQIGFALPKLLERAIDHAGRHPIPIHGASARWHLQRGAGAAVRLHLPLRPHDGDGFNPPRRAS